MKAFPLLVFLLPPDISTHDIVFVSWPESHAGPSFPPPPIFFFFFNTSVRFLAFFLVQSFSNLILFRRFQFTFLLLSIFYNFFLFPLLNKLLPRFLFAIFYWETLLSFSRRNSDIMSATYFRSFLFFSLISLLSISPPWFYCFYSFVLFTRSFLLSLSYLFFSRFKLFFPFCCFSFTIFYFYLILWLYYFESSNRIICLVLPFFLIILIIGFDNYFLVQFIEESAPLIFFFFFYIGNINYNI